LTHRDEGAKGSASCCQRAGAPYPRLSQEPLLSWEYLLHVSTFATTRVEFILCINLCSSVHTTVVPQHTCILILNSSASCGSCRSASSWLSPPEPAGQRPHVELLVDMMIACFGGYQTNASHAHVGATHTNHCCGYRRHTPSMLLMHACMYASAHLLLLHTQQC
jgi:hypothetical protein